MKVITDAQAMNHPTVAATINALGEIADELRAERDTLRLAAQAGLELLKMCQLYGPALAYGNTDIPTAITQLQAAMKEQQA